MKIYVIEEEYYLIFPDNIKSDVFGIFSSVEKAKEALEKFKQTHYTGNVNSWRIVEYMLDDENYGEEIEIIGNIK